MSHDGAGVARAYPTACGTVCVGVKEDQLGRTSGVGSHQAPAQNDPHAAAQPPTSTPPPFTTHSNTGSITRQTERWINHFVRWTQDQFSYSFELGGVGERWCIRLLALQCECRLREGVNRRSHIPSAFLPEYPRCPRMDMLIPRLTSLPILPRAPTPSNCTIDHSDWLLKRSDLIQSKRSSLLGHCEVAVAVG